MSKESFVLPYILGPTAAGAAGEHLAGTGEGEHNPYMEFLKGEQGELIGRTAGGAALGGVAMSLLPGDMRRRLVRGLVGAVGGGLLGASTRMVV